MWVDHVFPSEMNVKFQGENIDEKSGDLKGEFNVNETEDVINVEKTPVSK